MVLYPLFIDLFSCLFAVGKVLRFVSTFRLRGPLKSHKVPTNTFIWHTRSFYSFLFPFLRFFPLVSFFTGPRVVTRTVVKAGTYEFFQICGEERGRVPALRAAEWIEKQRCAHRVSRDRGRQRNSVKKNKEEINYEWGVRRESKLALYTSLIACTRQLHERVSGYPKGLLRNPFLNYSSGSLASEHSSDIVISTCYSIFPVNIIDHSFIVHKTYPATIFSCASWNEKDKTKHVSGEPSFQERQN